MRIRQIKRACLSSNVAVYTFDADATSHRVIRDPISVLLGRSSLALESEVIATDPYNRVGRWAQIVRK
jgi:hypothetical protein